MRQILLRGLIFVYTYSTQDLHYINLIGVSNFNLIKSRINNIIIILSLYFVNF